MGRQNPYGKSIETRFFYVPGKETGANLHFSALEATQKLDKLIRVADGYSVIVRMTCLPDRLQAGWRPWLEVMLYKPGVNSTMVSIGARRDNRSVATKGQHIASLYYASKELPLATQPLQKALEQSAALHFNIHLPELQKTIDRISDVR